jgi:diguanylate cyclase (GGDEF)-like protein/PAS domain S-box-containing protein
MVKVMQAPALPSNEVERLAALHAAEVLDTTPEEEFDGIARLAASICKAPIARVSLVDKDRQWFKSCVGDDTKETAREISFCGHAILEPDLFIVEDALADPRFADNPLVLGPDKVRFYAGAPLISKDGLALGSLCVVDHVPRSLDQAQKEALRTLGKQVVGQLELRRRAAGLRESEKRFRALADNAPVGIFETDADGACSFINASFSALIGLTRAELLGKSWVDSVHPQDREHAYTEWVGSVATGSDFSEELQMQRPDGTSTWVQCDAVALRDKHGDMSDFLGTCLDITARKTLDRERAEELTEAEALANTDQLTGLPNRRFWDNEVRKALAAATKDHSTLCVAIIDIDHFKNFNDEHGHNGGDRLLHGAAGAWRAALREQDIIARYGGEEFGLILPGCDEGAAFPVVERLRAATPFDQTVSAGIAAWELWESPGALVARADAALYAAKDAGRDRTVLAGPVGA